MKRSVLVCAVAVVALVGVGALFLVREHREPPLAYNSPPEGFTLENQTTEDSYLITTYSGTGAVENTRAAFRSWFENQDWEYMGWFENQDWLDVGLGGIGHGENGFTGQVFEWEYPDRVLQEIFVEITSEPTGQVTVTMSLEPPEYWTLPSTGIIVGVVVILIVIVVAAIIVYQKKIGKMFEEVTRGKPQRGGRVESRKTKKF